MVFDPKIPGKLERIAERYAQLFFEPVAEVPVEYCETREHFREVPELEWRPAKPGIRWGAAWTTGWFRGRATLPKACNGQRVFVRADTGAPEAMLLVDGQHRGVVDANHPVVMMANRGAGGRSYEIAVEAHAGHPCVGTQPDDDRPAEFERRLGGVELLLQREDVVAFVFDLRSLLQLADVLDAHSLRRHRILAELVRVYGLVDAMPGEVGEESWRPRLAQARRVMRPLLHARNGDTAPFMGLVGHSHIDTAWLWTVGETERKCARTFSSVLSLMEQYPEFYFLQSAPYHADIMRREYPDIFRRLRAMVRSGRWEPNGAMWVEPDCNVPGGEALVRQLLLGQQFTRQHFGYTADLFWQPDVFGYAASLPQLLRGCGVEFFLTTKIAWNDTTRFPYDTFTWKGIDGTSVLAHFNRIHCWPDPKTLTEQWQDLQHKETADRRLSAFGYGDGGGGPQFEMLEFARRVEDLEGCPRSAHTTVSSFMKGIRDEGSELPEWMGELYLELHRGTLTSIAPIKQLNRLNELALRDAELVWTLAGLRGARYPADALVDIWKSFLVNQFHDILPGSSITEVNDQAIEELGKTLESTRQLTRQALQKLAAGTRVRSTPPSPTATRQGMPEPHTPGGRGSNGKPAKAGEASRFLIVNSLSWDRQGELALEGIPAGCLPTDPEIVAQRIKTIQGSKQLVVSGLHLPALGGSLLEVRRGRRTGTSPFAARPNAVETPFARVRFDRGGRITHFVDKPSGRQLVPRGGGMNTLWIGEDVPAQWDNWDIDSDQQHKMRREDRLKRLEVVADGPLQLRLRCEYELGDHSQLTQDVVFHALSPQVDFETVVEWREKHALLKAGFETDVLAAAARHEIQYGHVERPTHQNRPADQAQFEVCNHRWTDLSENRFGVAVLNDCKYGIGVAGGDLRLTLIKSGTHPDPRGDAGRHAFTYAFLPHACGFSSESVVRPGYELNVRPMVCEAGDDAGPLDSLLTIDAPNVICESIKWAENGPAFTVRLYEAERSGTAATIGLGVPVKEVTETNMLEENPKAVRVARNAVRLYFRPFEIKTLRLVPG